MEEDLVLLRRYGSRIEADLGQQLLKSFDIASHVAADDAGGWFPGGGALAGGVALLVHPDDVERAAARLEADRAVDTQDEAEDRPRFFDGEMRLVSPLQGKSKVLAVYIVLVFGPLGLLYVRAWMTALTCWAIGLFLLILDIGVLWYVLAIRVLGAMYACHLISEDGLRGTPEFESRRLLEEAADMESVDRLRAIEIYESIVARFPDSRARREAERNIEALRRRPDNSGE